MMQLKFNLDIHSEIYEFFCFKLVYTWMMLLFYFSVCMHMSFSLCGCKQLDLMGWKVAHRRGISPSANGGMSYRLWWHVTAPVTRVTPNRSRFNLNPIQSFHIFHKMKRNSFFCYNWKILKIEVSRFQPKHISYVLPSREDLIFCWNSYKIFVPVICSKQLLANNLPTPKVTIEHPMCSASAIANRCSLGQCLCRSAVANILPSI